MAVKRAETYVCDICDSESNAEMRSLSLPVRFFTEQDEGRRCEPYIEINRLDVCDACLERVTVISARGAQGHNQYRLGER